MIDALFVLFPCYPLDCIKAGSKNNERVCLHDQTCMYLCKVASLAMVDSPAPGSLKQSQLAPLEFGKSQTKSRDFKNAWVSLLCSITMIHLHKTAKACDNRFS